MDMHDGLQLGTLVLVLFGILLTRYDFNALRKEMREELAAIRSSMERQTTTINTMLFDHHERLAKIETKMEEEK